MPPRPNRAPRTAWPRLLAAALACLALGAAAADGAPSGELRLHWDERSASARGPLATADALVPGIGAPAPSAWMAEAELRHTLRQRLGTQAVALGANLLAWHEQPQGSGSPSGQRSHARVNELNIGTELGTWSLLAGKKVLGWDVGYGFRPNDVVQQEARRTLLSVTPEGRPLLQLEHFDSDTATTLVWANPQHLDAAPQATRRAQESALAGRWYRRDGAVDWHAFARVGEHTRASLGGALAWVAGEELELHASARVLQRHDGWLPGLPMAGAAAASIASGNPWKQATRGGATQALLGLSWTGSAQQGLMVEAWHDGTALSNREWDAWTARNVALAGSRAPRGAVAGNLAWQSTPLDSPNLRRDSLFVRGSWQPGPWLLTLDVLLTPADRGRITTAGLQWQGDRLRLNASWRVHGGPDTSVIGQLPQRGSGLVAATWAF
jgi:hypothetical protein